MVCNVYNKLKIKLPVSQKQIEKLLNKTAGYLDIGKNFELTILVTGDQEIRRLNKNFRHKDKITDVLSFSQQEGKGMILPALAKNYLGDIVLSFPQIKRQAKKFNQSLGEEFSLLTVHGFLHLLGYKDETKKASKEMEIIQNKILNS